MYKVKILKSPKIVNVLKRGPYETIAESGKSMGLSIMLDAHSDLLSTSTVLDSFRVMSNFMLYLYDLYY